MVSTKANACVGGTQTNSSAAERWSSLPDDFLAISYLRLAAPIDRVRFAAVCTAWRAVASMHLARGGFPWLVLDPSGSHEKNYAYCPEEGMVMVLPLSLRNEAARPCIVGSHDGGWVASSEMIFNLFSGAKVSLSREDTVHPRQHIRDQLVLRKIVFSMQPTLSGCILAAITKDEFAFYKVGCPEDGWKTYGSLAKDGLMDITFCNGELYGITQSKQLNTYEFGVNNNGGIVLKKTHQLCRLKSYYSGYSREQFRYILELRGKLVIVTSNFTVLELVNTDTGKYEPVKMGDYALFLGPTCSKAVPVPTGERGDLQKNHIYVLYHCCLRRNDDIPDDAKVLLKTLNDNGYRVYYKRDRRVNGIRSTWFYVIGGFHPPMWLLPS